MRFVVVGTVDAKGTDSSNSSAWKNVLFGVGDRVILQRVWHQNEETAMRNIEEELTSRISEDLSVLFKASNLTMATYRDWGEKIVASALSVREWEDNRLISIKEISGDAPIVIYYKPSATAALLTALVAGIVGAATNPILFSCAILSAAFSLQGIKTTATPAEGLLFSIIYDSEHHSLTRATARGLFANSCESFTGIEAADFETSLHSLIRLGCLKASGATIKVVDPVIIRRERKVSQPKLRQAQPRRWRCGRRWARCGGGYSGF
jgi:hypothetical protein